MVIAKCEAAARWSSYFRKRIITIFLGDGKKILAVCTCSLFFSNERNMLFWISLKLISR
jgi:hypothetical protein